MFKKHILKLALFSTFIAWFVIFLTWISFFSIRYWKNILSIEKQLDIAHTAIHKKNLKQIYAILNNLAVEEIVRQTINNSTSYTHKIKKLVGVNFVRFEDKQQWVVFNNFDISKCWENFICKTYNHSKYKIILAETINYNFSEYINNIKKFLLFSILVSILLFLPIKWWITYLTKPLQENFEFMKNFVNNAWHELKTPIANINLVAQILKTKKDYDNEIVNQIIEETWKISRLIDTLLQLSIVSKPKEVEKINLEKTINSILKTLNTNRYNIKLDLKQKEILANPEQIEIILKNLIENAIKYNNEKKQIIIWSDKNKIWVENTGDQLSKQQLKRIFDIFYRVNKKKQGYGLGLAIVKKIVEVNWWKIKASSENWINKFEITF